MLPNPRLEADSRTQVVASVVADFPATLSAVPTQLEDADE